MDFTYQVINGNEAEVLSYTGTDLLVYVPTELDGYSVTTIGASVFSDSVNYVVVPASVTMVKDGALLVDRGVFFYGDAPSYSGSPVGAAPIFVYKDSYGWPVTGDTWNGAVVRRMGLSTNTNPVIAPAATPNNSLVWRYNNVLGGTSDIVFI